MGLMELVSWRVSATSTPKTVVADGRHLTARVQPGGGPLRILHILDRLGVGGTELVVLKLIRGLSPSRFEHRLGSLRGMEPVLENVALPGGELLSAGDGSYGFQFPVFRLAEMMRAYRPHIVHSRNWGAIEAIPAALLARIPVVIHSEHGYELDMLTGLPKRRRIFRRAAYAMADAVVTVTRELRDYHARQAWLSPERIRVIYNGVDTQTFFPRPEARVILRKRFGLPEQRFIVGTVGRMVPIKDHPTLLRAVEILTQRGIDAHALLVGSGPERERNEQFVKASSVLEGRVTFTGLSQEIPELLNTMDAFALPSISEGMSNTLLEAMATGLPLLATGVGGNTEVIEPERMGWLFQPRDAGALAARIALLASRENLRRDFAAAARARAVERFSLNRMLEDYTDLYLEFAERRGASEGSR
jgi:sugar transferase (PEP-CTERM/EpsH1 system associated)